MDAVRAPPFVLDHLPHDYCWAGAVAVSSVNSFDGDFCCQTFPYKPRYCFPNHVSVIIFLFVCFAISFRLGELFGRFSAIDAELVLLPEQQQRARIVAESGWRDLHQRGETILARLVRRCERRSSVRRPLSHKRPLYRSTISTNIVVDNS